MAPQGSIFGIVGALSAFPRRLAAREVEGRGAQLRRGSTRGTSHVVFGRGLLASATAGALETRVEAERRAGRQLLSENGFLRLLGLKRGPAAGELDEAAICQQAKLSAQDLAMLGLFDCFECAPPLYGFRDLILAKKYAGLIASGAGWFTVARAIHRSGPVASLTALSLLAVDTDEIYVRSRDGLSDLGGQLLLPIARGGEPDAEELFAEAEAAEADGRFAEAAELYRRCLAADPADSVAAFNRANCLKAEGRSAEAAHDYIRALKLDPKFAEAWFNFAGLAAERGHPEAARRHLIKALAVDPGYADAIYNLARLDYEAGRLEDARAWWRRYLELDHSSEWARRALRGIHFVDLALAHRSAG